MVTLKRASKLTPKGTPPMQPKTRRPRPYRGRPAKGYLPDEGRWMTKAERAQAKLDGTW